MDEAVVGELLGSTVVGRRRVTSGYSPAERWVVRLADGRSAFVKIGVSESTADFLRTEARVYAELQGPFMATVLGWHDGPTPMLVLEDLSGLVWPPPWDDARIESVLATMTELAATPAPAWVPTASRARWIDEGWPQVADDPAPLLATGIVSAAWLEHALPALVAASDPSVIEGTALLHLDVRSDNLCFRADGSAVLVDWNLVEVGNPRLDVAFWLPSLTLEGGTEPHRILPDAPGEAAVVSGFFAARCGQPHVPAAPRVRDIQQRQLRAALPWVCRELGLPPPF